MPTSILTSKGQTTIPKQIRDLLRLETGDRIDFVVEADGKVLLMPAKTDVRQLKGMLKKHVRRVVSLEEMEEAIAEGAQGGTRR